MEEINAHEELANEGAGEEPRTPRPSLALNTEWLASLSHELRSPLTAIQGYTSLLRRHDARISSEERQEFLQAISEGSNRIASILDCFLDIANLEAGTVKLHPLPVDLAQLVRDALLTAQQRYPDNTLSFTIQHGTDPTPPADQNPFVINGDASLLHKMLIQLLDNAQKYSAASTPIEVMLSCTSLGQSFRHIPPQIRAQLPEQHQGQDQEQRPDLIELSIQDHGIGIPTADHERIFERFERVDMQLTRQVSGLGLGLTMCKHIVALHHGVIWVESTPGEGSTFHVLFPTS